MRATRIPRTTQAAKRIATAVIFSWIALAAFGLASNPAAAQGARLSCAERDVLISSLEQRYGEVPAQGGGAYTLIDDYGHHPVEMAAVLAAARGAFPGRRIVLAFQPHRYTRTRDCFEDFVKVMGTADAVLLTEVYPAGEAPIVAADGRSLARALRVAGRIDPVFIDDVAELPDAIAEPARDGDVVICMGAGSIGGVCAKVAERTEEHP